MHIIFGFRSLRPQFIIMPIQNNNLDMQMRQKLIEETPTETPQIKEYFIDRYNQVVDIYNSSNSTSEVQLEHLDNSPTFARFNRIISKTLVKVLMVLSLAFLPLVNLVIFGSLIFYLLFLRREGRKHKNNLHRVSNPMQTYFFLPEICQQLGKHCTTLEIKTKDLQGFTFNPNLYKELKQKTSQTDTISVTIYDQYFYDSYHMFKKQQYKVTAWIMLGILLIAADVIFYIALFDLY